MINNICQCNTHGFIIFVITYITPYFWKSSYRTTFLHERNTGLKQASKCRVVEEELHHTNRIAKIGPLLDLRRKVYVAIVYSRGKYGRRREIRERMLLSCSRGAETKTLLLEHGYRTEIPAGGVSM